MQELQGSQGRLQYALDEARREAEARLPADAVAGIKQQLEDATAAAATARAVAAEAEGHAAAAKARTVEAEAALERAVGALTPRPTWEEFREHGVQVGSSCVVCGRGGSEDTEDI